MSDLAQTAQSLLDIHEAIFHQIGSLASSLDVIEPVSKSEPTVSEIKLIRESLKNFAVALFFMKEGQSNHEDTESYVLKEVASQQEIEEMNKDHAVIAQIVDGMQEELNQVDTWDINTINEHLDSLKKSISRFQTFLIPHTLKENDLLKRGLLKNS